MKSAAALPWSIAIYLAFAGAGVAADPRATQLTYTPWAKSCITHTCFVASGARGRCHPSGGGLSIIIGDDKALSLSAYFATKQPLDGAVSVQIDQLDPILIADLKCVATSCGGKLEIDSEFVERLKQSQMIAMEATDANHRKISFSLSLAGFARAFDGPGTEPKTSVKTISKEEMKEMLERSEADKRALECRE